jgi:hypothetical protein
MRNEFGYKRCSLKISTYTRDEGKIEKLRNGKKLRKW